MRSVQGSEFYLCNHSMSFSFLYFDRVRLTEAMVILYHVELNMINGSNPESNYKKIPWQSAWISEKATIPSRRRFEGIQERRITPPGGSMLYDIV